MSYQEQILEKYWGHEVVKDCFTISRIQKENKNIKELKAILDKYNIEL